MRLALAAFMTFASIASLKLNALEVVDLAKRIDNHIHLRSAEQNVQPTESVDAAGFLRRVTLDLAGRIPSTSELDAYLSADAKDRKQQLVQRLLESPDFAYHQRNQLDILLLLRKEHNDQWREFLLEATRENRPWDQLFREIMLPEETLSTDLRPVAFLKRRTNDLDAMTNDSSVTWFGVNISCAKCHDHPLVSDWTQAHYYGMSSFFKRTFQTRKGFLSERFDGAIKFTNTSGEEHTADFMFLTGTKVAPPALEINDEKLKLLNEQIKSSESDEKAEPPPRPDFRPRAQLVQLALADKKNDFFARNIANRIWARLFDRGIVHPLDQMHSENQSSHPELLNELANDLHESGYDLRRLIHAIVLTDTYARNVSRDTVAKPVDAATFAAAVPRPLSPHQLSLSLRIAGTAPDKLTEWQSNDWPKHRDELERQADGTARRLAIPDDGFQVSISESLWFSNNPSIDNDFLNGSNDRLVGQLKQIESNEKVADLAIKAVLSRQARDDERQAIVEYLNARPERREEGLKQVVWALMSSPEFRFNY